MQSVFIESNHCPIKNEILNVLHSLHNKDKIFPDYIGNWEECINIFNQVDESIWKDIISNFNTHSIIAQSIIIEHPQFGDQPITIEIINPIKI